MGNLGETLTEELTCETVFSIGGIGISESVVVTWIIMAVFLLAAFLLTRNLKVEHPSRRQLFLEFVVTWIQGISEGIVGEEGKRYASYLTSVLIYLGIANLIGILGFKPPTKDLNVTAALALMSIVLIEYVLPVGLPVIFSAYFDLFDGLIQAYVFVFLTGLFIKESME